MSNIQPKGEQVRKAVKWISSLRKEGDERRISVLIQEAAMKFNLSPKDEAFLVEFYNEEGW